jgi:hypothetical protein
MRMAQKKGVNPYDSHGEQDKAFNTLSKLTGGKATGKKVTAQ